MKKTVTPSEGARLVFLFTVGAFCTAVLSAVLLGVALRGAFDADIGYFVPARYSALPILWGAVTAMLAAGLGAVLFVARKVSFDTSKEVWLGDGFQSLLRVPELLLACAVLFRIWNTLSTASGGISKLRIAYVILSLFTVLYLILPVLRVKNPILRVLPGLGWILRELIGFVASYLDKTVPMNQPLKLIEQFLCFFIMLSLLSELRYPLGTARPIRFLLFSAPAAILSLSLPLGLVIGGQLDRFSAQIGTQAYLLAYAIFIICRMATVASSVKTPAASVGDRNTDNDDDDDNTDTNGNSSEAQNADGEANG